MYGTAAESRRTNRWTLRTLDRRSNPAAATTGESASGIRRDRWPNRPKRHCGRRAYLIAPKTAATFRVEVRLSEKPRDAALLVTARGTFTAKVNGQDVGSKREWNAFDRRDITDQLVVGKNMVEIKVTAPDAPQWGPNKDEKTVKAALAALVKITLPSGSVVRVPTDEHWQASPENTNHWARAKLVGDLKDARLGDPGPLPQPAAYLRRSLALTKSVQRARLYVTALGSYRAVLNGNGVGDGVLTPEFTDYRKRVVYQTYDVTKLLVNGNNVIAALLGDGWYGSPLTWDGTHFFAPPVRFQAQLEIEYSDGTHQTVVSDESWKAAESPIVRSEIYAGELYDARLQQAGWDTASFDDSRWTAALVTDAPSISISSQIAAPVHVIATLNPKQVTQSATGTYIFDMGQNMVGWTTLKVKGAAGTRVRSRFAEILNPDGTIYTANLRNADATDVYILRGGEEETFRSGQGCGGHQSPLTICGNPESRRHDLHRKSAQRGRDGCLHSARRRGRNFPIWSRVRRAPESAHDLRKS